MINYFKFRYGALCTLKKNVIGAYTSINIGLVPKKILYHANARCFKPPVLNYNYTQAQQKSLINSVRPPNVWKEIRVRKFQTTNPTRAPPPIILIFLRPLIYVATVIFGRSLRKWWMSLPAEKKALLISKLKQYRTRITGVVTLISLALIHGYISHLEQNPVTKRWRFMLFTHEQIKQIADIELEMLIKEAQEMFLQANHFKFKQVGEVVQRILVANSGVPGINDTQWKLFIVHHPTLSNAFALPNGAIVIYTKMIEYCDNEDQLSIILAHEISHTLLQHMAEQLSSVQVVDWMLIIPLIIVWVALSDVAAVFSQVLTGQLIKFAVHLRFSRFIETEADEVGLQLAARACFDVREAPIFWRKLASGVKKQGTPKMEWMSTHPNHETREKFLELMMPKMIELRTKCNCPPLEEPSLHDIQVKTKANLD